MQLTGYQLSQVVNVKLEEAGFDTIPSQQIYNYISKGAIPIVNTAGERVLYDDVKGTGAKYFVTVDDAKVWIAKYMGGKRGVANTTAELLKHFEDVEPAAVEEALTEEDLIVEDANVNVFTDEELAELEDAS
jgi:hypothetical protein